MYYAACYASGLRRGAPPPAPYSEVRRKSSPRAARARLRPSIVVVVVVVLVVRTACTRRHNYKVTSAPPSWLSLNKQKCLQQSTEFAKLNVWPSQIRR